MGILKVSNLCLTLNGTPILNDISIDFWERDVHAIVGPNGAGKSTLAYAIMGLDGYRDIEGDICFEGQSITGWSVDQRATQGITLAWQEPARYEGLSVEKFLEAATTGNGITVKEALEQVGLNPARYLHRAVDASLSGGERKKLELASILVMGPRFVMLDEPDSGIDVASLHKIFEGIQVLREQGATVVLITHSPTVMKQAEHAFLLCGGRVMDKGRMEKILPYFEQECIPCGHKNVPDGGGDDGDE